MNKIKKYMSHKSKRAHWHTYVCIEYEYIFNVVLYFNIAILFVKLCHILTGIGRDV